jgi:hypothetical protein
VGLNHLNKLVKEISLFGNKRLSFQVSESKLYVAVKCWR